MGNVIEKDWLRKRKEKSVFCDLIRDSYTVLRSLDSISFRLLARFFCYFSTVLETFSVIIFFYVDKVSVGEYGRHRRIQQLFWKILNVLAIFCVMHQDFIAWMLRNINQRQEKNFFFFCLEKFGWLAASIFSQRSAFCMFILQKNLILRGNKKNF